MLQELFKKYHSTLSTADLIALFEGQNICISIKDAQGNYLYSNSFFAKLMGQQSVKKIISSNDQDLTDNKKLLHEIKQDDEFILEEAKSLDVCEVIYPKGALHLVKKVTGVLHPIFSEDKARPEFVLGIFQPCSKLLSLDLKSILQFSLKELSQFLTKRSYFIVFQGRNLQLSKREIQVIIATVKGLHAGEIATLLGLKQTTVESYIRNIKVKLDINHKSQLTYIILETNLFDQILL